MRTILFALLFAAVLGIQYNIDASKKTVDVPKTLFGAFFEEISHAGDGGLYPEKVFNKNFAKDFQTFGMRSSLLSSDPSPSRLVRQGR